MDQRARIPVTLPRPNPTQSYWQDPPDEIADFRSTPDLPRAADTVIIGSGISGAAVAWHLLGGDPPQREGGVEGEDGNGDGVETGGEGSTRPVQVLMLEARQASSGATGRNGILLSFVAPPLPPYLHIRLR